MKKILTAFIFILLFLNPSLAEISCGKCEVGNCICEITDCDSGIFDVFSSTCILEPDYEYIFSQGFVKWGPKQARSYYVKALCSDGETQSDCTLITVRAQELPTTAKPPRTTTQAQQTTTTLPPTEAEGPDYLLWILVIILIIAIIFAVYYFFFMKKGRKTYEELYRKWRRR